MPLVAFCLRHFSADFIICMCEFDFRQAQGGSLRNRCSKSTRNQRPIDSFLRKRKQIFVVAEKESA